MVMGQDLISVEEMVVVLAKGCGGTGNLAVQ
jgi:hypothetical protein